MELSSHFHEIFSFLRDLQLLLRFFSFLFGKIEVRKEAWATFQIVECIQSNATTTFFASLAQLDMHRIRCNLLIKTWRHFRHSSYTYVNMPLRKGALCNFGGWGRVRHAFNFTTEYIDC